MKKYKVLTINPGSTSTKVALFEEEDVVFKANVQHDAEELAGYATIEEQRPCRTKAVEDSIRAAGVSLDGLDAVVGRGGGSYSMECGVYEVTELLKDHSVRSMDGVKHAAILGSSLADEIAKAHGARAFVVNSPDCDELQDVARITGIRGVYRTVFLHALNLKETAIRHAAKLGKAYEECNLVVCHLGGGLSVSAHKKGRMVDGYSNSSGDGPMAPTRCGGIAVLDLLEYCKDKDISQIKDLCYKSGGLVSHFGISDAKELIVRIEQGEKRAKLVWDAMLYQISKAIGSMAVVLEGKVDGILLTGGMAYSEYLANKIIDFCSWIAPVSVYPGEFEMEAMAAGAIRALSGKEPVKTYSGRPVWEGFDWD